VLGRTCECACAAGGMVARGLALAQVTACEGRHIMHCLLEPVNMPCVRSGNDVSSVPNAPHTHLWHAAHASQTLQKCPN
jgi:hypothetical protein